MSDPQEHDSTRYAKLGGFVAGGTLLLLACVVALGGEAMFHRTFKVQTFLDSSVGGLQVGANVDYRGVTIGKVSGIEFATLRFGADPATLGGDPATQAIVIEMSVPSSAAGPMTHEQWDAMIRRMVDHGLRARVTTAGLTGGAYVEMDFLDPAAYPPPALPYKPDELYVPYAKGGGFGDALDAVNKLAAELQRADVPRLSGHMDELAVRARTAIDDVDTLVQANRANLTRTLADLPETAARLRSTAARVDQILHDLRVEQLLNDLPATAAGAKAGVADARRLLAEARDLIAAEQDDVRSTLADLRRTAANAVAVTDDARQNPGRLLFGGPPAKSQP